MFYNLFFPGFQRVAGSQLKGLRLFSLNVNKAYALKQVIVGIPREKEH